MANPEHVEILKLGIEVWNRWRWQHSAIQPDLSQADLHAIDLIGANFCLVRLDQTNLREAHLFQADLSGANLRWAILSGANLEEADLRWAGMKCADLTNATLRRADLSRASLEKANLSGANLSQAHLFQTYLRAARLFRATLQKANLKQADLGETDLRDTNLMEADLNETDLRDANVQGASVGYTIFANINLSTIKGLERVVHQGPSTLGIDTLIRSHGKIPLIFLRQAGIPQVLLENIPSLIGALEPIQYYTCFISYSSSDQVFAERLYTDLQAKGVRCWFAPEDLKVGDKFWHRIDEAIRLYDKLLVVLSQHSVTSSWVENEVLAALEKESQQSASVLFPIRLDESLMQTSQPWAASLRRSRHIGDFTRWKEYESYQQAFERLLQDLKA